MSDAPLPEAVPVHLLLKCLRKTCSIKRDELARELGLDHDAVAAVEQGRRRLPDPERRRWVLALGRLEEAKRAPLLIDRETLRTLSPGVAEIEGSRRGWSQLREAVAGDLRQLLLGEHYRSWCRF